MAGIDYYLANTVRLGNYCSHCGRSCGCVPVYTYTPFIPNYSATLVVEEAKPKPSKKYDSWAKFYRTLKTTAFTRAPRGRRQSIPDQLLERKGVPFTV